jgi:hypothetical protein
MNAQCLCGFDYTEFVDQHSISPSSQVTCPNCEAQVTTGAAAGAVAVASLGDSEHAANTQVSA